MVFLGPRDDLPVFSFPSCTLSQFKQEKLQKAQNDEYRENKKNDTVLSSWTAPPNINYQCHINMDNLRALKSVSKDWRAAVILELMNCTYSYTQYNVSSQTGELFLSNHQNDNSTYASDRSTTTVRNEHELPRNNATNTHYLFRPHPDDSTGYRFVWHPHYAHELQKRLAPATPSKTIHQNASRIVRNATTSKHDSEIPNDNALQDADRTLCIGLVNRLSTRRIGNMDELEQAIRKAYPQAVVEQVSMNDMTPFEQFTWWSRQSVVILPHGAASTNLLFLKRGAAVVEVFPPHYYWWGFWKLAQSIQVRYYGYFPILTDQSLASNKSGTTTTITTKSNANHTFRGEHDHDMDQRATDSLQDYKQNCRTLELRSKHRNIAVQEPSIPHLLVLLQRATLDGEKLGRMQHQRSNEPGDKHDSTGSSYIPQISYISPHVIWSIMAMPRKPFVYHLDNDVPPIAVLERVLTTRTLVFGSKRCDLHPIRDATVGQDAKGQGRLIRSNDLCSKTMPCRESP